MTDAKASTPASASSAAPSPAGSGAVTRKPDPFTARRGVVLEKALWWSDLPTRACGGVTNSPARGDGDDIAVVLREFDAVKAVDGAPALLDATPRIGLSAAMAANHLVRKLRLPCVADFTSAAFPCTVSVSRYQLTSAVRLHGDKRVCVLLSDLKFSAGGAGDAVIRLIAALVLDFATRHGIPQIITLDGASKSTAQQTVGGGEAGGDAGGGGGGGGGGDDDDDGEGESVEVDLDAVGDDDAGPAYDAIGLPPGARTTAAVLGAARTAVLGRQTPAGKGSAPAKGKAAPAKADSKTAGKASASAKGKAANGAKASGDTKTNKSNAKGANGGSTGGGGGGSPRADDADDDSSDSSDDSDSDGEGDGEMEEVETPHGTQTKAQKKKKKPKPDTIRFVTNDPDVCARLLSAEFEPIAKPDTPPANDKDKATDKATDKPDAKAKDDTKASAKKSPAKAPATPATPAVSVTPPSRTGPCANMLVRVRAQRDTTVQGLTSVILEAAPTTRLSIVGLFAVVGSESLTDVRLSVELLKVVGALCGLRLKPVALIKAVAKIDKTLKSAVAQLKEQHTSSKRVAAAMYA